MMAGPARHKATSSTAGAVGFKSMLADRLKIRPATIGEFKTAVDWAAAEGWNPGLDDLAAFYSADPQGFLMGFIEGTPVSSISAIRYGDDFGFIGFYIVHPDYRGQSVGIATWKAGMAYLKGRNIALDGVIDQQENYKKSGFIYWGRSIRHSGVPAPFGGIDISIETRDITEGDMSALQAYDQQHFPARRIQFTQAWALQSATTKRTAKIALNDGNITGYGAIRECRDGYKIGPLFADTDKVAKALLTSLIKTAPAGAEVSLDTPEDNPAAVNIALKLGLKPVFETARMYTKTAPDLPIQQIYGITTFELG